MVQELRNKLRDFMLIVTCITLPSALSYDLLKPKFQRPPLDIVDLDILTPAIKAGEDVKGQLTLIRHEACATTINRFLLHDTEPRIALPVLNGGHTKPGPVTFSIKIPTEATYPPGVYTYRVRLDLDCPSSGKHLIFQPDARFRIID